MNKFRFERMNKTITTLFKNDIKKYIIFIYS